MQTLQGKIYDGLRKYDEILPNPFDRDRIAHDIAGIADKTYSNLACNIIDKLQKEIIELKNTIKYLEGVSDLNSDLIIENATLKVTGKADKELIHSLCCRNTELKDKLVVRNGRIMDLEQQFVKLEEAYDALQYSNNELYKQLADIEYLDRQEVLNAFMAEVVHEDCQQTKDIFTFEGGGLDNVVTAILKLAIPIDCYSKNGEIIDEK